jgi:hypothetical protein
VAGDVLSIHDVVLRELDAVLQLVVVALVEADVRDRQAAGLLAVELELALDLDVARGVLQDLDGVAGRSNRTVRADAVQHGLVDL